MAEMFSGDWTVEWFPVSHPRFGIPIQQLVIAGARTGDGVYDTPLVPTLIAVSGQLGRKWSIELERPRSDGLRGVTFESLNISRTSTAYTIQGGLVVRIGSALICRNVDPKLNPWHPFVNPYNFILPKRRPKAAAQADTAEAAKTAVR